jgi:hypothetical protein
MPGSLTESRCEKRLGTAMLVAVLLLAGLLRLWRIDANGFGTEYYAAGVRSLLQGARLFFYNAFDPGGVVSLDKPPVAFWIQAAFAQVLGFSAGRSTCHRCSRAWLRWRSCIIWCVVRSADRPA